MPCHAKHSSITPPRANAGHLPRTFPGLGLRRNRAFDFFTRTETSEESPPFVNWVRHSGNNKNIHKQLKTFSQLLLLTLEKKDELSGQKDSKCCRTIAQQEQGIHIKTPLEQSLQILRSRVCS